MNKKALKQEIQRLREIILDLGYDPEPPEYTRYSTSPDDDLFLRDVSGFSDLVFSRRDTPLLKQITRPLVAPASRLTWGWSPIPDVESRDTASCEAKENSNGE